MKKLLSIAILFCATMAFVPQKVHAQFDNAKLITVAAGDTISTSSSLDSVSKIIPVTGAYASMGIAVEYKKTSGTVALKAYLYRRIGQTVGSTWVLTDSSAAFVSSTSWNAVQFEKTAPVGDSYKIEVRGSDGSTSTQVVPLRFYYTVRKYH